MPLDPTKRRSLARAFWAYSGKGQKDFAVDAGIKYDRLRASLNDDAKSPPSTDELLLMAEAAGVPRSVALDGWPGDTADRVAALEQQVRELATGLSVLAADSARHTRELQELPGTGRREEPRGGAG